MFRHFCCLILITVASCSPLPTTPPPSLPAPVSPSKPLSLSAHSSQKTTAKKNHPQKKTSAPKKSLPKKATAQAKPPVTSSPQAPLAYHRTTSHGVTLYLVSYDDRDCELRVADQPQGTGTRWIDARSAAATYGGIAAINGGFFTPEGKPLGLLVETGTRRGSVNHSSLGAGYYISSPKRSYIVRRQHAHTAGAYNLLQTGPMLVEKGHGISGLSQKNQRPRSFILWDGGHHWAIGYAEPCSLHELSRALVGNSPAGFKVHTAINLDGGRSSNLWVSQSIPNGGKTHKSFLNKPVRNYLVLKKR